MGTHGGRVHDLDNFQGGREELSVRTVPGKALGEWVLVREQHMVMYLPQYGDLNQYLTT